MNLDELLTRVVDLRLGSIVSSAARSALAARPTKVGKYSNVIVASLYIACLGNVSLAKEILEKFVEEFEKKNQRADVQDIVADAMLLLAWISGENSDQQQESRWTRRAFEFAYDGEPDEDVCVAFIEDIGESDKAIQYAERQAGGERAAVYADQTYRFLGYLKFARFHADLLPGNFHEQVDRRVRLYMAALRKSL